MKTMVKNRNDVNLAVLIEGENNTKGLAFVVHGLGGFKEQLHIRTIAKAFLKADYTVVSYDAANTIGESGGKLEDATLTNYFEDLVDITSWSGSQRWYKEPFALSGHSLGGACSIMYAAKYSNKVGMIIPISAFIAGELYKETLSKKELKDWQSKGYTEEMSRSKPGVIKKINWHFLEDSLRHDMRKLAPKVQCLALLVVGSEDVGTPAEHQQQFINRLSGPSKLHIIEGMQHNPRSEEHNAELSRILNTWMKEKT